MKREAGGLRAARLLLFFLPLLALRAAAEPWNDPQWLRLGHWKPLSDASTAFFLTPDGARNPKGEYDASVAALADPDFRCRFPARAAWLGAPTADCAKFADWRTLMDAGSVSLIFASAYMSNPSSMFGHTFLRLERRATGGDPLRDNTLNFAAETGADGGVLFAVKGLLGLYPGRYTVMPYHMKVVEYNGIENRDLWEYRLALSTAEVDRLVAHAWEMGRAEFPYYFFSKNCSYQLMPALEAAAPRLTLMPGSPAIVGPADTLYAVRRVPGLVSEVRFRPSHATSMLQRRRLLSAPERRAAEAYASGRPEAGDALSAAFPSARRALVLDAAQDFVLYKRGFSPDVPEEVRELERTILTRRAKVPETPLEVPVPKWAAPPDEGHLRHRLWVGEGARKGGSFTELAWRPGYHDLLDRRRGYLPGAAIEGFTWRLRYDADERKVYLRDARLVEILSASPWDGWTRKPSWSAGTGADTAFELGKPASRSLVYEGHVGSGLAFAPNDDALVYGLTQVEGAVGSPLREGWRAAGALRAGASLQLGGGVSAILDGALTATAFGDKTPNHRLRAGLNWAPKRDLALRAEGLLRGPHREAGLYAILYH